MLEEPDSMAPDRIPLDQATRIAFGSSESADFDQWTELAVYHLNDPEFGKKQWLAEIRKCERVGGRRRVHSRQASHKGTLDAAVKIFFDSTIARVVISDAEEWARKHANARPVEFATDQEALRRLYGEGVADLPRKLQKDFGTLESTTRMALKMGNPVKVPLRTILPYVDIEAFRRDREGNE